MTKRRKLYCRTALFVTIFVILFLAVQNLLIPKWKFVPGECEGGADKYSSFYKLPQNSLDYIVLGTSHSLDSINSLYIYSKTGLKGYNLCSPSQSTSTAYYWLVEACKYQSPEFILFDVSSLTNQPETIPQSHIIRSLVNMRFSSNKLKAIIAAQKGEHALKRIYELLFPVFQFHDRWDELTVDDWEVTSKDYIYKGSYIDFNTQLYTDKEYINCSYPAHCYVDKDYQKYDADSVQIPEDSQSYFQEIISYCEQNGIRLIPIKTPTKKWIEEQNKAVLEYLSTYNMEVLDLNQEMRSKIDWNTDTCDSGFHTNYWGVIKTSDFLVSCLEAQTGLIDKTTLNRDDNWNADLRKYEIWEQEQLTFDKEKSLLYLQTLAKHKENLFIIISVRDEACAGWNADLEAACSTLGLSTDFYDNIQNSYIAIIDGGHVRFEQWVDAPMELDMELEWQTPLQISVSSRGFTYGDISEININDTDYSLNGRGLNIVVIDKPTETIISSACIDTHDPLLPFTEKDLPNSSATWTEYCESSVLLDDGTYEIMSANGEKCFEDQQFEITHLGNGCYSLQEKGSGHYMSVAAGGNCNGTDVVLTENIYSSTQKWFIIRNNNDTFSVISLYNQLALEISDDVNGLKTDAFLCERDESVYQQFIFTGVN